MEPKYWVGLITIALALIWALIESAKRKESLARYWNRTCAGRKWKAQFPNASKEEIREFLAVFTDAFMFEDKQALFFAPEDKLMDIYQALYPPKWSFADALETETFAEGLKEEYGFDIVPLWREGMTLGEIFELTQRA